ncbi:TRBP2 protein, partial [Spizaetus tyrannus]|nr:TRBP2 protein [Spizaetus tyrannus]
SLEQMLAANPGKTPISLLQEYGTRIGKTPGYDLLKAEGQAHQPNFTFRVTVGDISCTGGSLTPSASRLPPCLASLAPAPAGGIAIPILEAADPFSGWPCLFRGWQLLSGGSSPRFRGGSVAMPSPDPPIFVSSPHGGVVVQKGWRLPEYTVTQESGPAHRKEFTMTCRVERFVEIGSGTSKKLAKRNAAAKMLVRIGGVPMEPREGSEAEVEEDQWGGAGPRLEGLRGRAPGCTWDSLRGGAGEKIVQLR